MKKYFLILLFLMICGNAYSAELLVQAKDSPFDTGAKKGDIIVVRPDGWKWGKEECLPNYIVVKIPDIKYDDAKVYEQPLYKTKTVTIDSKSVEQEVLVKKRKYNIDALKVEQSITAESSVLSVASKDVSSLTITEKILPEKVIDEEITIK